MGNKGMVTACYNRITKPIKITSYDTIHIECNKRLQSKSWVTTNQKSKFKWAYHDTMGSRYSLRHFGNIWYEVDKPQTIKVTTKPKQIKETKQNKQTEKLKQVTRNKTINLMSGLACSIDYKKIYG